jgi:hypothetical protein
MVIMTFLAIQSFAMNIILGTLLVNHKHFITVCMEVAQNESVNFVDVGHVLHIIFPAHTWKNLHSFPILLCRAVPPSPQTSLLCLTSSMHPKALLESCVS